MSPYICPLRGVLISIRHFRGGIKIRSTILGGFQNPVDDFKGVLVFDSHGSNPPDPLVINYDRSLRPVLLGQGEPGTP